VVHLHLVLADPVPEARATAAKALGILVERLGEIHFPDLVPGLLRTLKTDPSGIDRQGAAQGLSEVLSGFGMKDCYRMLLPMLNLRDPLSGKGSRLSLFSCLPPSALASDLTC